MDARSWKAWIGGGRVERRGAWSRWANGHAEVVSHRVANNVFNPQVPPLIIGRTAGALPSPLQFPLHPRLQLLKRTLRRALVLRGAHRRMAAQACSHHQFSTSVPLQNSSSTPRTDNLVTTTAKHLHLARKPQTRYSTPSNADQTARHPPATYRPTTFPTRDNAE